MTNYDEEIEKIADYTANGFIESEIAFDTARLVLLDTLGCGLLATHYPACTKLLGPTVKGTTVPFGSRVIGTNYILDPVTAAFNIGTLIRWLDYNDTWLAKEWGHPSDNLGAILALTDHLSQKGELFIVRDLLHYMIKAHEIQGILALENSFNRLGLDHVILVKLASTAVSSKILGGSFEQIKAAISQSFLDTGPLRTYRHAPNTGPRKSWAAGDATARGVFLSLLTKKGEIGYPKALSTPVWGFNDVILKGNSLKIDQPFGSYVMENVLFKISFPAEFHAQTAVEAAIVAYPHIKDRLDEIEKIEIETHESAIRIIVKDGPLTNPADRDHCLQYMVAVALLNGNLTADHYEEKTALDPRIDRLRNRMVIKENKTFSKDYLDPGKRSIANSLLITMKNGDVFGPFTVENPLGHKARREEAKPKLFEKFEHNALKALSKRKVEKIIKLFEDKEELDTLPVKKFVDLFIP